MFYTSERKLEGAKAVTCVSWVQEILRCQSVMVERLDDDGADKGLMTQGESPLDGISHGVT